MFGSLLEQTKESFRIIGYCKEYYLDEAELSYVTMHVLSPLVRDGGTTDHRGFYSLKALHMPNQI